MTTNRNHDDGIDDDIDALEDDIKIDPFLDAMENQDSKRGTANSPRRKIEALLEKQRLKKLLEDYPDYD